MIVIVKTSPQTLLKRKATGDYVKHGKTEAANTVHHRLAGLHYTLLPTDSITITHCTSLKV